MKRKTRILAIIMLCTALVIMGIVQCFATPENISNYYKEIPADLGSTFNPYSKHFNENMYYKLYLKITLSNTTENNSGVIKIYDVINSNTQTLQELTFVWYFNSTSKVSFAQPSYNNYNNKLMLTMPVFVTEAEEGDIWYIPIYCYNVNEFFQTNNIVYNGFTFQWYYSTTTDQNAIINEAYRIGYNSGYSTGFNEGLLEGQNIQQYTNLVGYVEQLIGQFTGSSAAQYITPIAIVLVVLFVYFLFIRFLLSLVKAKGIIKTCDIIMIVACIIMLVVMYAPMLDLTIKTEQINSSEETTEAVQINRSNIYVESTETGDIYYGPVGTAIVTKSETIEDIYKISEDIETEAIAYEKD